MQSTDQGKEKYCQNIFVFVTRSKNEPFYFTSLWISGHCVWHRVPTPKTVRKLCPVKTPDRLTQPVFPAIVPKNPKIPRASYITGLTESKKTAFATWPINKCLLFRIWCVFFFLSLFLIFVLSCTAMPEKFTVWGHINNPSRNVDMYLQKQGVLETLFV